MDQDAGSNETDKHAECTLFSLHLFHPFFSSFLFSFPPPIENYQDNLPQPYKKKQIKVT